MQASLPENMDVDDDAMSVDDEEQLANPPVAAEPTPAPTKPSAVSKATRKKKNPVVQKAQNEAYVFSKLEDYLRLQNAYEAPYRKIVSSNLSAREKRKKLKALKPLCINCRQLGGTTFETKAAATDKGDKTRQYLARCGNRVKPCSLDISIQLCDSELLGDLLSSVQQEITETKNSIIAYKNSALFGMPSPPESFDVLKKQLQEWTDIYEVCLNRQEMLLNNPQDKAERDHLLLVVADGKREMAEYERQLQEEGATDPLGLANQAMITYKQLEESYRRLRELQYGESVVIQAPDGDGECMLHQQKLSRAQSEYFSCEHQVLSYHTGTGPRPQAQTTEGVIPPLVKRARQEVPAPPPQPPIQQQGGNSPGNVEWDTEDEKRVWDQLSPATQELLQKNPAWMQEVVDHCVLCVKSRRPCSIAKPPTELIVPPFLEEDGFYDFGVHAYNQVLRDYPMLLQTYKDPHGTGNIDFDKIVRDITRHLNQQVMRELQHVH